MANWNEADHPRDEQGKFTDKGGGSKPQKKVMMKKFKDRQIFYFLQ